MPRPYLFAEQNIKNMIAMLVCFNPAYTDQIRGTMKRLLILILAGIALAGCSSDDEIDASCLANLQCGADAFREKAEMLCKARIEDMAKSDLRWNHSRDLELLSRHYEWKDQAKGVIAYFGQKALIQTPSGKYATEKYECDIDPKNKKAPLVDVKISIQ